jgi:hypothetical protein
MNNNMQKGIINSYSTNSSRISSYSTRVSGITVLLYTQGLNSDFAFQIFSIFFYFVYVFIFALSADYFFKNIYF